MGGNDMRYKAVVAYDGTGYHGWQTQHQNNSIEEKIMDVLKKMHTHEVKIVASGRTDSGVHAFGQVFHFDSELGIDESHMKAALNSQLPKSIRIQNIEIVNDEFHARFDSIGKRYDYYLRQDDADPMKANYTGLERHDLDLERMQEACQVFLGTHDFTSFTSTKIDPRKDRNRTITRVEVFKENEIFHFILEGDGFLRYMVRMIVGTIIMAGRHHEDYDSIKRMLDAKDKHECHYKAEPQGLYLIEVKYEK